MSTPTELKDILTECGNSRCGHILMHSEQIEVAEKETPNWGTLTCPRCGGDSFYTLNTAGQAKKQSDKSPREINVREIQPSPRMGTRRTCKILACKDRALAKALNQKSAPSA